MKTTVYNRVCLYKTGKTLQWKPFLENTEVILKNSCVNFFDAFK